MKIAVLYGGVSGERDVSISSGKGIVKALEKNNHDVIGIDFHPDRLHELIQLDVDLVFIGLHGKYGEDGRIQGLLDMMNIPYVGSGVLASALAMDKDKAKQIFKLHNLPIAEGKTYQITRETNLEDVIKDIADTFTCPFVIKPNREGSTLGVSIIRDQQMISKGIHHALKSDHSILVEDYIKGREVTVAVLGPVGAEQALPIVEIIPKNELYDYESKYDADGSEHIVPAQLSETVTKEIQAYAVQAHQLLGCEVYSRVDFILQEDMSPIILEVNTLPGMTPTSLFPDAAQSTGMTYEQMIEKLVQLSINKSTNNNF